jgi:hypothetical protein
MGDAAAAAPAAGVVDRFVERLRKRDPVAVFVAVQAAHLVAFAGVAAVGYVIASRKSAEQAALAPAAAATADAAALAQLLAAELAATPAVRACAKVSGA